MSDALLTLARQVGYNTAGIAGLAREVANLLEEVTHPQPAKLDEVTVPLNAGWAAWDGPKLARVGRVVVMTVPHLTGPDAGQADIAVLPAGYRPSQWWYEGVLARNDGRAVIVSIAGAANPDAGLVRITVGDPPAGKTQADLFVGGSVTFLVGE